MHTVCMRMGDEDGINAPETMLGKPLYGSSLKALADVDDDGPVTYHRMRLSLDVKYSIANLNSPSRSRTLIATDVLR